jgi:hypothetical protein
MNWRIGLLFGGIVSILVGVAVGLIWQWEGSIGLLMGGLMPR